MNTASTIRSVVAGRSERFKHRVYEATGLGEVFNDNNVHLSIKSSPDKTVASLSLVAEKAGPLLKLNDTGSWRRRRALLVPHTFLYYFGESTAATDLRPHGVIDLELYTDVQVIDRNVVKLAPRDETSPIRTFYLRLSSVDEAEAWAHAIRSTRYDYVREERDALRVAKNGLADQLVSQAELLRECQASLEASRRSESATVSELARRNAEESRRVEQVRALLAASASSTASVSYGGRGADTSNDNHGGSCSDKDVLSNGSEGDSGTNSSNGRSIGADLGCTPAGGERRSAGVTGEGGLSVGIGGGVGSVAATALSELAALEEVIAERAREVASLKMSNEAFREREALAADRARRDVADALRQRDMERDRAGEEASLRLELEAEIEHLRAELEQSRADRDEARANLGVVAAACREADAKSRELQEHRRILAREFKASRAEQKRLSAALSCATRAAATAAATAAAATAAAKAATAAAVSAKPAGDRDRSRLSSNSSSREKEELAREPAAADPGDRGGEGQGEDGKNSEEVVEGGVTNDMAVSTSREGQNHSALVEGVVESPNGDQGRCNGSSDLVAEHCSSFDETGTDPAGITPAVARDGSAEETVAAAETAPLWCRPSSLDVATALVEERATMKDGGGGGSESGATSPEMKSPCACDSAVSEGDSVDGGIVDAEKRPTPREAPGPSSFGGNQWRVGAVSTGLRPSSAEYSNHTSEVVSGNDQGEGETACVEAAGEGGKGREEQSECALSSSWSNGEWPGTPATADVGGGAASKTAVSPSSPPASLPTAFGESSSLRFNQMVQSFSASLRETRRARRTPLLGSLDGDDEDDGGVTDGTGTDGGDSRHDTTATTAALGSRKNSGTWSSWSAVGSGSIGHGLSLLPNGEGKQHQSELLATAANSGVSGIDDGEAGDDGGLCRADGAEDSVASGSLGSDTVSITPDAVHIATPPEATAKIAPTTGVLLETDEAVVESLPPTQEQPDSMRPLPPCSPTQTAAAATDTPSLNNWRDSLEAAAETVSKKAAVVVTGKSTTAEWLRVLGRRDGEDAEVVVAAEEGGGAAQSREGDVDGGGPLSAVLSPQSEENLSKTGDGGGNASSFESAATPVVAVEDADGGVGGAAVAVALAAAERGGRVSAEAAAAARRWEAKLKGSLVSMTGGVRWGMAPQQSSDVTYFQS